MKYLTLLYCLFAGCSAAVAQSVVTGRVVDTDHRPIAYATVALLRDTIPSAAVASDLEGRFRLAPKTTGDYRLSISSVGYSSHTQPITVTSESLDLGEIALTEGVEVDAVVLTVQKPIVTTDAEKLAYSVEDDPEAQSSTLEEIIRKVPQLSIDAEGNVLVNGQSDYKILVNGHPSNAFARNFSEVIKSMPANSIKRIEVITNPSMKYDAEGTGGVLNIITSKARFDGYNGSLNTSLDAGGAVPWMTSNSANFAVQTGKLTLSAALYHSYADEPTELKNRLSSVVENFTGEASYRTMQSSAAYGYGFRALYANLQASYQIDSLNLLTAEFSTYDGYSRTRQRGRVSYLGFDGATQLAYANEVTARPDWQGYDLGVNYQHTFGRENHTLTLSENLSIQPLTGSPMEEWITSEVGNAGYASLVQNTRSRRLENIVQIDYQNPIDDHHTIEAGLKHSFDRSESFALNQFDLLTTEGETELKKQIVGLYGGYAYKSAKFSARAGARAEGAWYALSSDDNGRRESYRSSLVNVIPYLSVTYLPKQGQMWALSYTQRLRRPGVEAMSPYVSESLTTRSYGNPDLETGVSHSFNLRYSLMTNRWTLAFGATTNFSQNLASAYSFIDDEGLINSTYANDGRMQFYIADLSLAYRHSANFTLSLTGRGGWGRYRLPNQGIENEGWCYTQSLNAMFGLWKGARLTLSEYLMLPEPSMESVWQRPIVMTGVRLGQKFLKDKLEFSLTVQNPLSKEMTYRIENRTPSYLQTTRSTNRARSVRFALSWRFGKQGIAVKQTNRKTDTHTESMDTDKSSSIPN